MLEVRPMQAADAPAVAELTRQLGYDVTAEEVAVRRGMMVDVAGSVALVAEDGDQILGWIQALDRILIQEKRVLEIGGLVVDEERRGEGVGARLLDDVARWARQNGYTTLFVRSNVAREGAHGFYPALGFTHQKTSHTYVMELE